MKPPGILAALLALGGLVGTLAGVGYHRGYLAGAAATRADADRKVDAAHATAREAQAATLAAAQERDALQDAQARLRQQLLDAQAAAVAAVADRARAHQHIDRLTAQRQALAKEAAHAQPDCAPLEHLPVCAAVAERLWGDAADAAASPGH